jgi:hypothetical protein
VTPFAAFAFWTTFLFDGWEPRMLLWAVLLSSATALNAAFLLVPFLREPMAERPLLVALVAGSGTLVAAAICFLALGSERLLPLWSPVGLAWIASFVFMSASGVAGCLAERSQNSSFQNPNPNAGSC